MFKLGLGFSTLTLLTIVTIGIADADDPAPVASQSAPMTLAQTPSPLTLVCCFGGTASSQCTQSSPNQPGCEFVMAYNCGNAGYSCDAGKGICSCNTSAADSGQPQPSQ
jgi:hypothetical protein